MIEAQATEHVRSRRYERTERRTTQRNGHRDRLLITKAGDVELEIPKMRTGSFFPSILKRRRRIDRGLWRTQGRDSARTPASRAWRT